jgi:nucleotide-binding universal stress UspA family protein
MIVVGYSADRYGVTALEHGLAEAKLRGTGLLIINTTSGESYADPRFAGSGQIVDLQTHLADSGVPFELTQLVGVNTADELLAAMDRPDAELLVIGVRHRSPVGKLLLGSVSQQLILECPKPVLAVKPDET